MGALSLNAVMHLAVIAAEAGIPFAALALGNRRHFVVIDGAKTSRSILSIGQDDTAGERQQGRKGNESLELVLHELLSYGAGKKSPGWTGGCWLVLGLSAYLLKLNWVILPLAFTSQ